MPHAVELDWSNFLSALTLALVRISGMVAFAPFFSSTALPLRTKAVFVGVMAWLLAPLVAALPRAQVSISFSALIGELAVGLVYGLTLTLLTAPLTVPLGDSAVICGAVLSMVKDAWYGEARALPDRSVMPVPRVML